MLVGWFGELLQSDGNKEEIKVLNLEDNPSVRDIEVEVGICAILDILDSDIVVKLSVVLVNWVEILTDSFSVLMYILGVVISNEVVCEYSDLEIIVVLHV